MQHEAWNIPGLVRDGLPRSTSPAMTASEVVARKDRLHAQSMVATGYAMYARGATDAARVHHLVYGVPIGVISAQPLTTFFAKRADRALLTVSVNLPDRYEQLGMSHFFTAEKPWADVLGAPPGAIGEITRLAVDPALQSAKDDPVKVDALRRAYRALRSAAQRRRVWRLIAVMPSHVNAFFNRAGIPTTAVPRARLATERPESAEAFRTLPRYWLPDDPWRAPKVYVVGPPFPSIACPDTNG
jgi:hypothetical protein